MSISAQTVKYPTDPLTAAEIDAVFTAMMLNPTISSLFNRPSPNQAILMELLLKEPDKAHVINFEKNLTTLLNRKARALVYDNTNNQTREVIVTLPEPPATSPYTVTSFGVVNKVMYPNNNFDNFPVDDNFGGNQQYPYFTRAELIQLVLAPTTPIAIDLRNKLHARNVSDAQISSEEIYPYAFYTFESFRNFVGAAGANCPDLIPLNAPNKRYMPAVFFNPLIIPGGLLIETANWGIVEGIFIILDCNTKSIYKIIDDASVPPHNPAIVEAVNDPYPVIVHPEMKPIDTTMPDGPSFTVDYVNDTHKVTWGNWEFHWSYQRSGLSLYNIYYTTTLQSGSSQKTKIMYKNCASDTIVVYNAEQPTIARTYVSADSHNWPILQRLTTLVRGRDVPAHARLFPVVTSRGKRVPVDPNVPLGPQTIAKVIPDAVAVYEQDGDVLWRVNQGVISVLMWPNYAEPALTGSRKRQLVVRSIFSGFYYLFQYSYVFNQDGSMESYCDLMGQTTNQWVETNVNGAETPWGQRIAKQLLALNHTHSCVFRMDFDIDSLNPLGGGNSVSEQNSYVIYDKTVNKCGQGIKVEETTLAKELSAMRQHNMGTNRTWEVFNPNSKNRLGFPRGYSIYGLGPNGNSVSLARDDSPAHSHLGYLKNHLMVTKYNAGEEYAAGEFPVLANEATGIDKYVQNNESIVNTDIVVWYNQMFFHTPHTEDYPFISLHRLGVSLTPSNFFGMNPACSLEYHSEEIKKGNPANVIGDSNKPVVYHYDSVA